MAEDKRPESVPYIVYESALARQEEQHKREREKDKKSIIFLTVLCGILTLVSIVIHISWMVYESKFDTYYYEQDGAGINNINTGEQGDVLNGAEAQNQEKEGREIQGGQS